MPRPWAGAGTVLQLAVALGYLHFLVVVFFLLQLLVVAFFFVTAFFFATAIAISFSKTYG